MTWSEQSRAWQDRAEAAERENERMHAVVQELRDTLVTIRDETAFKYEDEMPIAATQNAVRFAHGRADYALTKAGMAILPCPMGMQCIPAHPTCPTCRAAEPNGEASEVK